LNAVIMAVVKPAIPNHRWRVIGIEDGYDGLVGIPRWRELNLVDPDGELVATAESLGIMVGR
jgi:6-phosphofructokinase 1